MAYTQKELTEIKLMFYKTPLQEIDTWLKKQSSIGDLQIAVNSWIFNESNPAQQFKLNSIKKKLADISDAQMRPVKRPAGSKKKPLLGPGEWKQHNNS